jgi:hypothetical protein
LALVLTLSLAGCPANDCPAGLPACPTTAPSFKTDVTPIISRTCFPCHAPGGEEAEHDFTTFANVFAQRGIILDQIFHCAMPPAGPLTGDDRLLFLEWLECNAPDN